MLAMPDFSSAFNTIYHSILVHRLHTDFGFTDTFLQWMSSYLTDRTQYVNYHRSDIIIFYSFHPVAIAQLHTIIKNSKPTSCALDPIPTYLLLEYLDNILSTLAHCIDTSILSGQFPTNMMTAIVKSLLRNVL